MNKANSPILEKILQGHKFRFKDEANGSYLQVETGHPFMTVFRYEANGGLYGAEGSINEEKTEGEQLAVYLHGFGKTAPAFIPVSKLELIDG